MSGEKLYAVRNDEGEYWDFEDRDGFWELRRVTCPTTSEEEYAKDVIHGHGGHVVTFVEEPEKVKLPKKVAGWVATVKSMGRAITDIFDEFAMPEEVGDWLYGAIDDEVEHHEERGLMLVNAYQYGYTVAKEKKYNVKVPHTDDSYFYKVDDEYCNAGDSYYLEGMTDKKWFTDAEIEHYGLGDCEKVWCDSDDE